MAVSTSALSSGRQLYENQPGTTVSTIYTAPVASTNVTATTAGTSASSGSAGSATAYVKEIIATNTTGTAATITLHLVPSGGTASAATALMFYGTSISGNDAKVISGINTMMPAGSTLQALQGTASAITLVISGTEVQ